MDGVQTAYYQKVASYLQSVGQLPFGEWYDMTPADELAAIASIPGTPGWFATLDKRAEADALIDLIIAKNGSWEVLSSTTSTSITNQKNAWVTANFGTIGSGVGRAPAATNYTTNFNKGPYGGANKLLIDDRTDYVDQFVAGGGKAFKYYESGGIRNFGGTGMSIGPVSILP